jgi:predicted transcriptional regulator
MRYIKDSISLSPEHDYPLLRQVLRSGLVTHDQLFEFMQLGNYESSRTTFNWRVRRLTKYGLTVRHTVPSAGKAFVYSITPAG